MKNKKTILALGLATLGFLGAHLLNQLGKEGPKGHSPEEAPMISEERAKPSENLAAKEAYGDAAENIADKKKQAMKKKGHSLAVKTGFASGDDDALTKSREILESRSQDGENAREAEDNVAKNTFEEENISEETRRRQEARRRWKERNKKFLATLSPERRKVWQKRFRVREMILTGRNSEWSKVRDSFKHLFTEEWVEKHRYLAKKHQQEKIANAKIWAERFKNMSDSVDDRVAAVRMRSQSYLEKRALHYKYRRELREFDPEQMKHYIKIRGQFLDKWEDMMTKNKISLYEIF